MGFFSCLVFIFKPDDALLYVTQKHNVKLSHRNKLDMQGQFQFCFGAMFSFSMLCDRCSKPISASSKSATICEHIAISLRSRALLL